MSGKSKHRGENVVATNRKARYDFEILDTVEAGLVLTGTEVKSLRDGRANLKESYVTVDKGEAFLVGAHISPYSHGNIENHDPLRRRKLLLHRREIERLSGELVLKGLTIVALSLYFRDGVAKAEIAVARGKKLHDKRETKRRREAEREAEAAIKQRGD